MPLQFYFTAGQINLFLASARGQRIEVGMIFYRGPHIVSTVVKIWLFSLITSALMCLCGAGLILLLLFWPCMILVVEKQVSMDDAFSLSRLVTRGNEGATLLLAIVSLGVLVAGIAVCGVGVLLAQPFVMLLWSTAYLMMSGQLRR